MNDARTDVRDPEGSIELPRVDTRPLAGRVPTLHPPTSTARVPTIAERWLVPLMWVAIGVVASATTPQPVADPPLLQMVIAEVLGWAALVAIIGLVAAAVAARSSLTLWSYGIGVVGLIGLAMCQMFGHPVFGSAWGLSQVALVSGGLAITARVAQGPRT